jgi:nitrate reductase molybdenum cofactor assembly chaperone
MTRAELFDRLAAAFCYPQENHLAVLERCRAELEKAVPEAATALSRFMDELGACPLEGVQELYVRTFDLNPVCALEIGWHLFGENYERGEFLVKLRRELRRFRIPESSELPDHLTQVLPLVGRLPAPEAAAFAREFFLPVLEKIQEALERAASPYRHLAEATRRVLSASVSDFTREAAYDHMAVS